MLIEFRLGERPKVQQQLFESLNPLARRTNMPPLAAIIASFDGQAIVRWKENHPGSQQVEIRAVLKNRPPNGAVANVQGNFHLRK
jgi:hypothetical protein